MNTAMHGGAQPGLEAGLGAARLGRRGLLDSYAEERLPVGAPTCGARCTAARSAEADGLQRDIGVRYRVAVLGCRRRRPRPTRLGAPRRRPDLDPRPVRRPADPADRTGRSPWRRAATGPAAPGCPSRRLTVATTCIPRTARSPSATGSARPARSWSDRTAIVAWSAAIRPLPRTHGGASTWCWAGPRRCWPRQGDRDRDQ